MAARQARGFYVAVALAAAMAASAAALGAGRMLGSAEPPEHGKPKSAPKADPHPAPGHAVKPAPKTTANPRPQPGEHEPAKPGAREPAERHEAQNAAPSDAHESAEPPVGEHGEPAAHTPAQTAAEGPIDADKALKLLRDGNARWVNDMTESPNTGEERRTLTGTGGQHPFAAVLTCADSRVPLERVFDRGVGDIFGLRVAGNIAGPHEAGSLEYGVAHLHIPLIVVMGHSKCGAVAAAAAGGTVEGNVASLVESIAPAVERARRINPEAEGDALAAEAVKENVWQTVFDLIRSSDALRGALAHGQTRLVGAVYDVKTGKVEWLGEHPWQTELIAAFEARQSERREAAHDGE